MSLIAAIICLGLLVLVLALILPALTAEHARKYVPRTRSRDGDESDESKSSEDRDMVPPPAPPSQ
jgi:hypothetical protein